MEAIDQWQELPAAKIHKALPVPETRGGKKRGMRWLGNHLSGLRSYSPLIPEGGRRARVERKKMGMTDLRKMQNRIKFGEEEGTFGLTQGIICAHPFNPSVLLHILQSTIFFETPSRLWDAVAGRQRTTQISSQRCCAEVNHHDG